MSSSSEEEIEELLRNGIRRQPRNFWQRRFFWRPTSKGIQTEVPTSYRSIWAPFRSSGATIRAQNTTKQGIDGKTATISVLSLPWNERILSRNAFVPWNFDFNRLECDRPRYTCNTQSTARVYLLAKAAAENCVKVPWYWWVPLCCRLRRWNPCLGECPDWWWRYIRESTSFQISQYCHGLWARLHDLFL